MISKLVLTIYLAAMLCAASGPPEATAMGRTSTVPARFARAQSAHPTALPAVDFAVAGIGADGGLAGRAAAFTPAARLVLFYSVSGSRFGLRCRLEYHLIYARPGLWLACLTLWHRAGSNSASSCLTIGQGAWRM